MRELWWLFYMENKAEIEYVNNFFLCIYLQIELISCEFYNKYNFTQNRMPRIVISKV